MKTGSQVAIFSLILLCLVVFSSCSQTYGCCDGSRCPPFTYPSCLGIGGWDSAKNGCSGDTSCDVSSNSIDCIWADNNGDGMVDLVDNGDFAACFGPVSSGCEWADYDGNGAVDGDDQGALTNCINSGGQAYDILECFSVDNCEIIQDEASCVGDCF